LSKDVQILQVARDIASEILETDAPLALPEHAGLRKMMVQLDKQSKMWSRIS
jgi:ATP-dependent DNA helicase RecG C-terminal